MKVDDKYYIEEFAGQIHFKKEYNRKTEKDRKWRKASENQKNARVIDLFNSCYCASPGAV